MYKKLEEVETRYEELSTLLSDPEIISDRKKYETLIKEHSSLTELVRAYREYKGISQQVLDNKELLKESDPEMRGLAKSELEELEPKLEELDSQLRILLLPKDPRDDRNVLLEIRPGAGGDEAGLFVVDLLKMYQKYAEQNGWKVEPLSMVWTGISGLKELICSISGDKVYSKMKYEGGVHRVQRVPKTETQGRVHTSTVTVAVLPEAEEVDVQIDPSDLRVDVFRSSGPGGQSVNTTDSAVRITHVPTGIVATCQDEKSQLKNKNKAMKILRTRLLEKVQEEQTSEIAEVRRGMLGTGDRSERIRTYNYPQNRITDHRVGLTVMKLSLVMLGNLDEIIPHLIAHFQAEQLKAQT
ncbi:peptide chain release factor 1 [Bdellovibrionota bacterium]